jgi:two-component system chemotaxis response regulator CheB
MSERNLIVIGTSTGGLDALRAILHALPSTTRASVFVVMHTGPGSPRLLADILARVTPMRVDYAEDGAPITAGTVRIAPPDVHLTLEPHVTRLTQGPKENRARPSIDVLFRSAAQVHGPRVVGVILTGELDDGVSGLWTIKRLGGAAVVQDPAEAVAASMPRRAVASVDVDYCVRLAAIGPLLGRLADTPIAAPGAPMTSSPDEVARLSTELSVAHGTPPLDVGVLGLGPPSPFACPECQGVLREIHEGPRVRFRCHTGHAHSLDSLLASVRESVDTFTWSTVRACQESALVLETMAARVPHDAPELRRRLIDGADAYRRRADSIRNTLLIGNLPAADDHPADVPR